MQKIKVITHNGSFHADDACAVAVLTILYKGNIEVTRTRDQNIIEQGHIILDVGRISDGERFFDHHQEGGAGARPNGIPYAAFGLIWKKFGKEVCGGNERVAEKFDMLFVQGNDAMDNGVAVTESKFDDIYPVSPNFIAFVSNPTWKEDEATSDQKFFETVALFQKQIERVLTYLLHEDEARALVEKAYQAATDKRIILLDDNYPYNETLMQHEEPLFAVFYSGAQADNWHVKAIRKNSEGFEVRRPFPEAWAGKVDEELSDITGVPGAIFCHNKRFLTVAKTKEGALKLAHMAANNN